MHDLRTALRALSRRPGFTAIAVITLALGIGANVAIFSIVDAVLLRPLPYADADRLVMPWAHSPEVQRRIGFDRLPSSPGDVVDFVTRNSTFERMASVRADRANLTGGEPERVGAVRVSVNFFDTLGVHTLHGRTFTAQDETGGRMLLLGYGLWQRRFGGDTAAVGQPLAVNGQPATIVGILPSWFSFPSAGELPAGLGFAATPEIWILDVIPPAQQTSRAGKSFALVGRLKPGVTPAAAEADLAGIAGTIARDFPASNAGFTMKVFPLRDQLVGGVRTALIVLLTAVGLVLLIACANVTNLLLVRAAARQREIALRFALGCDRWHIFRQLLVESLVMALLAGVLGLAIAWLGLRSLLALLPAGVPAVSNASLDWRAFLFTLIVCTVTALLFGSVPAFQATRLQLVDGLRDGGRGSVGSRRAHRTRNILVVLEVALAAVLLIGSSLLIQTFIKLLNVDTGFNAGRVLTMEVALPRAAYPNPRAADFFTRLVERLGAVPGVEAAAAASTLPLTGSENLRQVTVEGRPKPEAGREIISDYRVVTPGYFRAMGIVQISGDGLSAQVLPDSPPTLLVNATMAEMAFPGESPIGRRLKLTAYDQPSPWYVIAGVVGDTRQTSLDSAFRPQVYVHQAAEPSVQMVVVLRTRDDPSGFIPVSRAAVRELDANQPVGRVRTMEAVVGDAAARQRFTMFLSGIFAALAVVLAVVGLYAVISYSVAERTHELGVRLALGETPGGLLRLVLGEGARLIGLGLGLGLVGSFAFAQLLESQLFGVSSHDPRTFLGVPLVLAVAALLGCLVPALRATRVDPMIALRAE